MGGLQKAQQASVGTFNRHPSVPRSKKRDYRPLLRGVGEPARILTANRGWKKERWEERATKEITNRERLLRQKKGRWGLRFFQVGEAAGDTGVADIQDSMAVWSF